MAQEDVFKKLVSHCKEYGFVFPSSEIYDGLGAVYDYGQYGVELKNNIKKYWWDSMTLLHGALAHVEHLRRLCRVKQLVFGFPLPFLLVPCLADVPCDVRNLRHHLLVGGTFHCYHFHVQSFLFVSATKFGNKQKGL